MDISLTGAAACAMPVDWVTPVIQDWSRLRTVRVGEKLHNSDAPEKKDGRLERIVEVLEDFLLNRIDFTNAKSPDVIVGVFIEGYAFAQGAQRGHSLGEIGGVVKLMVRRVTGRSAQPVAAQSARKLLTGKGNAPKQFVLEYWRKMGAPFEDDDTSDAATIANWGLSELGRPALIGEVK